MNTPSGTVGVGTGFLAGVGLGGLDGLSTVPYNPVWKKVFLLINLQVGTPLP